MNLQNDKTNIPPTREKEQLLGGGFNPVDINHLGKL